MATVGIDEAMLFKLTDSLQLERHVSPLRGRPVLYVRGLLDPVDPAPSLERLEAALEPSRSLHLRTGHATVMIHRRRIQAEIHNFLQETKAI